MPFSANERRYDYVFDIAEFKFEVILIRSSQDKIFEVLLNL